MLAVLLPIVAAWAAVWQCPQARADSELLQNLIYTKQPELEADGLRVVRRYDADGTLESLETIDERVSPHLRRVLEIREGGRLREVKHFRGRDVIRLELERYSAPDTLAEKTVEENGVRTVDTFTDSGATRKKFRGSRLLSETELHPFLLQLGETADWRPTGEGKWDQYLACRKADGKLKRSAVAACKARYVANESSVLAASSIDLSQLATPYCKDSDQVFLTNGFRIDRKSCLPPGPRAESSERIIGKATRIITDKLLGCLNELNPGYGRQLAQAIVERSPRIQCGGTDEGKDRIAEQRCQAVAHTDRADTELRDKFGKKKECRKKIKDEYIHSAAVYAREFPNDVAILREDPNLEMNTAGEPDYLFQNEADYTASLASTIYHELLHAADHHGYHDHNNRNFPHIDDVFGCQAICTATALPEASVPQTLLHATREGCLACVRAPETTDEETSGKVEAGAVPANDTETSRCGSFPPATRMKTLTDAYTNVAQVAKCRYEVMKLAADGAGSRAPATLAPVIRSKGWQLYRKATEKDIGECKAMNCPGCSSLNKRGTLEAICPWTEGPDALDLETCLSRASARFELEYDESRKAIAKEFSSTMGKSLKSLDAGLQARKRYFEWQP